MAEHNCRNINIFHVISKCILLSFTLGNKISYRDEESKNSMTILNCEGVSQTAIIIMIFGCLIMSRSCISLKVRLALLPFVIDFMATRLGNVT